MTESIRSFECFSALVPVTVKPGLGHYGSRMLIVRDKGWSPPESPSGGPQVESLGRCETKNFPMEACRPGGFLMIFFFGNDDPRDYYAAYESVCELRGRLLCDKWWPQILSWRVFCRRIMLRRQALARDGYQTQSYFYAPGPTNNNAITEMTMSVQNMYEPENY